MSEMLTTIRREEVMGNCLKHYMGILEGGKMDRLRLCSILGYQSAFVSDFPMTSFSIWFAVLLFSVRSNGVILLLIETGQPGR